MNILKKITPSGRRELLAQERTEVQKVASEMAEKDYRFIERVLEVPINKFDTYESYLAAGTKLVWASFRAQHVTAMNILKTQWFIEGPSGARIDRPEVTKFIKNPNPHDTFREMLYQWTFHMKSTGSAYWLKDELDGAGRPKHVYPLLPQFVRPVPSVENKISGYIYHINGEEIDIARDEMIHFRRPHPTDGILGLGDVEPSEAIFNEQINRDTYREKFIEQGAHPSGILTREDEINDPKELKRVKEKWAAEYGGKKNIGKVAFLNGKWNFLQLGLSLEQMQATQADEMSIKQIFINHGVPLSVAGWSENTNLATARQDEINWKTNEIMPMVDMFAGRYNAEGEQGLIPLFGQGWMVSYEMSGLVNVAQVWDDFGPAYAQGVLTLNEMREKMGLEAKDGVEFDTHLVPAGKVPIEMVGQAAFPDLDELGI